ncbi:cobalamin biosynthesis protein CbiX [Betaproteobacteria bacterium SCN1]|jgi:(2Fe-2S) ferredoxin|nr:cobalamin biosynthesis protein CbiX [Betaproteobacteria bacterium SCN1]
MTLSDPTHRTAVILLSRGGNGPAAAEELQTLQERMRALLPDCRVTGAYVDRAEPSLPQALDACGPVGRIVVQPVFVPGDHALERWLRKVALRWRHRQPRPEATPEIVFSPALGGLAGLADLLAQALHTAAGLPDVAKTASARWQHDPVAWSDVPVHERHVLVCMGPRCTALGAGALWHRLVRRRQDDSALRKHAMVLQTGCQYPCNHGPLMIVYPDGLWYGRLDAAALDRIIDEHLPAGTVDEAHLVHRTG